MILALKTADSTTHLAIFAPSTDAETVKPLATDEWESGRDLSNQLLERLKQFLAVHHHAFSGLTAIIIFSGPGSFTSLRIGHAVANALADSLAIPVVGAEGHSWVEEGLAALKPAKPGHPALPNYGADAHITRPKA